MKEYLVRLQVANILGVPRELYYFVDAETHNRAFKKAIQRAKDAGHENPQPLGARECLTTTLS
ncbi:hypothetical protein LCGC14_2380920 [marine sediment metagenome]|uniref:Uncharacterized protein n=1 Tax=marine sediment metagenome TaxID=412755 RepID=A0A0F9EDE0_9ZZZZ